MAEPTDRTRTTSSAPPLGGTTSSSIRSQPAPVAPDASSVPLDRALPEREVLDRLDRAPGEVVVESVGADIGPSDPRSDEFGLDLRQSSTGSGDGRNPSLADLGDPRAQVADLDAMTRLEIDPGYDLDTLAGQAGLDGRIETGTGGLDGLGSSTASGPADGSDYVSDGTGGTPGAKNAGTEYGTSKTGIWDSIRGIFGGAEEKATQAAADAAAGNNPLLRSDQTTASSGSTVGGAGYRTDATFSTEEGIRPGGAARGTDSSFLQGINEVFLGKKQLGADENGKMTWKESEREKQMKLIGEDHAEPTYEGPMSPGSAPTEAIVRSLELGLGGQRGGEVDPFDDPQGDAGGGEVPFDPEDAVVDPGPDGFAALPPVDSSSLPDADDLASPYVDDGEV